MFAPPRSMISSMFMAEREPPSAPVSNRSPFVRLRELLGDAPPGKPPISLAVGEPQHAMPDFVGPIMAAHIAEFGRYPLNKGTEAFCAAAADWLGRRFALPRPVDPATEVLVLNGTREGLFLAAIAARNWVSGRIPARSRRAAGDAARPHGRLLHRLAQQPARRGREPRLSGSPGGARPPLRLPGVQR